MKKGPSYELPDLRPVRAIQNRMRLQGGSVVTGNGQFSSEDFITQQQGWRISGNGDAEFNNVTLRGEIEASEFRGAPTANIVGVNGSFDTDTTGWTAYSTEFPSSQIARVTSPVRSGSGALRVQSSSGAGVRAAYTEVMVAPGDIIHAAGWVLKDDVSDNAAETWWDTVTINVDFYDSTDTLVHQYFNESIQSAGWYDGAGYSPTPEWRLLEVYGAAPLNLDITKARIYFSSYSNAGALGRYALYVDDVTIGIAPLLEVPYMVTHEDDERKRSVVTPQQFAFESQFSNYPYGIQARHNAHTPSLRVTGPYGFGNQAPQLELEHDLLGNMRYARFGVDQVLIPAGHVGAPGLAIGGADSGIYGGSTMGVVVGGTLSYYVTGTGRIRLASTNTGTVGSPAISWAGNTGTGMYLYAAGSVGFTSDGTLVGRFGPSGITLPSHVAAATTPNCYINPSSGLISRSSSTRRIKRDIETLAESVIDRLRPVTFKAKPENVAEGDDPDKVFVGFIAEEVADADERLAARDGDGEVVYYDTNGLMAHMVAELQSLRQRVAELEAAAA